MPGVAGEGNKIEIFCYHALTNHAVFLFALVLVQFGNGNALMTLNTFRGELFLRENVAKSAAGAVEVGLCVWVKDVYVFTNIAVTI